MQYCFFTEHLFLLNDQYWFVHCFSDFELVFRNFSTFLFPLSGANKKGRLWFRLL